MGRDLPQQVRTGSLEQRGEAALQLCLRWDQSHSQGTRSCPGNVSSFPTSLPVWATTPAHLPPCHPPYHSRICVGRSARAWDSGWRPGLEVLVGLQGVLQPCLFPQLVACGDRGSRPFSPSPQPRTCHVGVGQEWGTACLSPSGGV